MSFWSSRPRQAAPAATAAPAVGRSVQSHGGRPQLSASHPPVQSHHPYASHAAQPSRPTAADEYQLEQYDGGGQAEPFVDDYGGEYDDGHDQYADEQQQQDEQHYYQQQQQQQRPADEYVDEQYSGQYDEYGPGEDEQWMDEQQRPEHDEQPMYEHEQDEEAEQAQSHEEVAGEYDEQAEADDVSQPLTVAEIAQLGALHALASHSHPLHPVQESEMEPTSPEIHASALPSNATLSSTLASIAVDRTPQPRSQQPTSPPSAASSLQSPNTPQLLPLSPSSASRQRYIDCVELLEHYCRQTTADDETFHAALKLVEGLRHRYSAFAASSVASSVSASATSGGTELAAAVLRFMQSSLAPVQLQPLLQHAGRQVVEHLSLALSSVGCVVDPPSSHLSFASSLVQSRVDALRLAFRSRSYSQPLLYVSPHHAADIEELSFALSLPASSFFVVPTMPHPHSPSAISSIYTMDANHLHALLARHRKERRQSAVLLLTIGSLCSLHSCSSGYQLDDVQQLTDIADEFGLWVHAEGSQIVESGQQLEYQQRDEQHADDSGGTAQTAPDNRNWKERYLELVNGSAAVQSLVPSRVHSISLHANDYFTLPDTLAITILTMNAALNSNEPPDATGITRAAVSSSSASVLSLWSQLLAVSYRSFSALLALFPALLTLSHAKLDAAKAALQSFNASLLLSPADYAVLPAPSFLFFSLSLSPPFNHSYFNLTASQANDLLADNLLRKADTDAELCSILCSPSLTASALFSHTGFLYSSFTPCPAAVDSVERHTAAFQHFLDCLQAELSVIAACGALMPTLHSLLSNESDLEVVPPSSLSAHTRPGLAAFRFTPSSIPAGFHYELTKSLLADLTAVLPAVFRGGECDAAGGGNGSGSGAPVIVVEMCEAVIERGVQSLVRSVHKLSKRVRLPSHVESELSAELKRSISATEAKLKAGQAGGGGVIRSIPIVGSFFSFFAGRADNKGHSYDINSSYAPANSAPQQQTAQPEQTASKSRAGSGGGAGRQPNTAGSDDGSGKATALTKPISTPPQRPVPASHAGTVTPHSTVLSAASDVEDGMFSRATSAVHSDDSNGMQQRPPHEQSSADEPQTGEHPQQLALQQADETLSPLEADTAPTASEQHLFDQLASRDPASLRRYILEGTVLTIFFPSEPSQHNSPSSAISLYLFYDAESASLCWCEPGARYVAAEQTLPIAAIAELHLGNANSAFPADAEERRCFSIVSDVIQLHCEEEDAAKRDEIVLALYSLLSNAQTEQNDAEHGHWSDAQAQQQHTSAGHDAQSARTRNGSDTAPLTSASAGGQAKQQQSKGAASKPLVSEEKTADPLPTKHSATVTDAGPVAARQSKQPASTASAAVSRSATATSASAASGVSVSRALELLESGSDFTVFLVDRSQPQLTSRHPVVLWWIPDSAAGKGRLCWSRRSASGGGGGQTRLEYHPSRSLLLSSSVELSLGKRTKALCNGGMDDVDGGRCVSVMVDRTVLNLAAETEAARDEWLAALHAVMADGDDKRATLSKH